MRYLLQLFSGLFRRKTLAEELITLLCLTYDVVETPEMLALEEEVEDQYPDEGYFCRLFIVATRAEARGLV